jgi:hypothetical protein
VNVAEENGKKEENYILRKSWSRIFLLEKKKH